MNNWLGTNYSLEEVAGMDPLIMDVLTALNHGLFPPKPKIIGTAK